MTTADIDLISDGVVGSLGFVPSVKVDPNKPFSIPPASMAPVAKQRTWEEYANEFRDLTVQTVQLHQQHDLLRTEQLDMIQRLDALQKQRCQDRDRLALVSRARNALEANNIAQANRMRITQNALSNRDVVIAEIQAKSHQVTVELEDLRTTLGERKTVIAELQSKSHQMTIQLEGLRKTLGDRNTVIAELSADIAELKTNIYHMTSESGNLRTTLGSRDAIIAGHQAKSHQMIAELASLQTILEALQSAYEALILSNRELTATHHQQLDMQRPAATRTASYQMRPSLLDRLIASLALRRARQAVRLRCWPQAEALYEAVLMVHDDPRFWTQLGNILREQGRYAGAVASYRKALVHDAKNAERHFMLGLAEMRLGNEAAGRQAYREALACDPALRQIHCELLDPSLID